MCIFLIVQQLQKVALVQRKGLGVATPAPGAQVPCHEVIRSVSGVSARMNSRD